MRDQGLDGSSLCYPRSPNARDRGHPPSWWIEREERGNPLGRGAQGFEGGGEIFREGGLGIRGEFFVVAGEVEDVDGGFAFGVDERDLDVALVRS